MKILRSGAMILNNGGHIILDEYDKMPKQEQKKFNQAMEQQRATYNKGGHIGNAECKTTVITACNPKNERWVPGDIIDNMPFDPSTITRFDIIIKTQKETHENEIRAKMQHIMKGKRGELEQVAQPEYIKGLLNYLRRSRPTITPEAEELLINKFVEFTQIEQNTDAIPIQTRQMEGIQRLCEAYAKLTFNKKVDCHVVEEVIKFYQQCLSTLGMNVSKGVAQFDLSGKAVNRDKFFEDIFRELSYNNEEEYVFLHELGEKLMESDKFKTTQSVESYIEKRVKQGYLFEPKPGVFKRQ
jgi:DNA replicative helicase MCM subunit Mcm2 (Cdc46/Mcm family)